MYNATHLKQVRKTLRNNATPAERTLWQYLKGKGLSGKKFRRQYSIGNYIVDFYCVDSRLAIELDGEVHYNDQAYKHDLARTDFLKKQNITIIRFENKLVFQELDAVLQEIKKHL